MNNEVALQQDQISFLQTLIESRKLPAHVSTVQEAFTISQMGRELGFSPMIAFHYILPIQGRLTLTAKAIGALLRRGKVIYKTLEDAVYVYKDGSVSENRKSDLDANGEMIKPVDRRTTILFTRDGVDEEVKFTWVDATTQGLTGKDNWSRMPREMLWARCLSKGANRIAPDLLLGLYCTEEMWDSMGQKENVKRDDDGHINEIIDVEAEVVD